MISICFRSDDPSATSDHEFELAGPDQESVWHRFRKSGLSGSQCRRKWPVSSFGLAGYDARQQWRYARAEPREGDGMALLSPWLLVLIAILLTTFALVLLKKAADFEIMTSSWIVFFGSSAVAYALSFVLYSRILKFFVSSSGPESRARMLR
jgi:hypothetical protein